MTRLLLLLSTLLTWISIAHAAIVLPVGLLGCNADELSPVPGSVDLFVGRLLANGNPNSCSGTTNWNLSLLSMNWDMRKLNLVREIFHTPQRISDGHIINSAYDPTIAKIGNELWVSFECGGSGIQTVGGCVGPLDINGVIDPNRTTLVMNGGSVNAFDAYNYSISHPFIFPFHNHVYLYWTAVQIQKANFNNWGQLTSRGIEIENQSGRFFAQASGNTTLQSSDPRSVEVMGVNPADPNSNRTADFFQVIASGEEIYVASGLGGGNCTTPISGGAGCYRLAISKTTQPLAYHAFNQNFYTGVLPDNAQEYTHITRFPDGHFYLMGMFLAPSSPNSVTSGFGATPLPENDPFFAALLTPGSQPQPTPTRSNLPHPAPITTPVPAPAPTGCNLDALNRDGSNSAAVQYVYCIMLARPADAGGLNVWKSMLDRRAITRAQMVLRFYNEPEFVQRTQLNSLSNAGFVNMAYLILLHRDVDSAGSQNWVNNLAQGLSRLQVFTAIENSGESKSKNPILF